MRIIVAVFVLLWLLSPAHASAQCTAPGCDLATAVILQARATGRAVLTAEAPPTWTPVPTSTPQPTATATSTPEPTTTATMRPTDTATPQPTPEATGTLLPTLTATVASAPARADAMSPAAFFLLALAMLLFAALFIFIGVKMLIKVWNAKNS